MGLIRWFKKEIESTNLSRRRQSAPPITACLANPESLRDDAYLKAIQKFNEYRRTQRLGKSINESIKSNESNSNSNTNQQHKTIAEKDDANSKENNEIDESILISDVSMSEEERNSLKTRMLDKRKLENSAILYSNLSQVKTATIEKKKKNINNKNNSNNTNRLSLPNFMPKSNLSKEISFRHKSKKKIVKNNNTILEDEIDEFEQIHCHDELLDSTYNVTSPPSKFYKQNSDPFTDHQSAQTPDRHRKDLDSLFAGQSSSKGGKGFLTPKKLLGKSNSRKIKGKAPQPPKKSIAGSESSELTNYNGSFKHYDFHYSSLDGEAKKSSPPKKINNLEVATKKSPAKEEMKKRRFSPPYQTVINKHGDVVEYALPYTEQDPDDTLTKELPPLPSNPPPTKQITNDTLSQFEQIINENFVFLKDLVEDSVLNQQLDACQEKIEPMETFMERRTGRDVMVTDLDRSNDTGQLVPSQSKEILEELETLEKWSKNIEIVDDFLRGEIKMDERNLLVDFRNIQNNIMVFASSQIKYKSSVLRNSFLIPLEFSTGSFQNTSVTLRRTVPNIYSGFNNFAEDACKKEFEILSKMKHINITVMMGICYDPDLNQMSLVLEPFDFTLNHYLHQMDKKLTIMQTIYVLEQIGSAVQYLHECGFVHSNISSHCVLLRKHPYGVKLSCFELTTQIEANEVFQEIHKSGNLFYQQKNLPSYTSVFNNTNESLKEKYYKLSKQSFYNRNSIKLREPISKQTENYKFLPYLIQYRKNFSLYYYQAPELIPSNGDNKDYVIPAQTSDIYSLALLLWECLNYCVPFIVYTEQELEKVYGENKVILPLFIPERCEKFLEIFDNCLKVNSSQRTQDAHQFLVMLNQVKMSCIQGNIKELMIDFDDEIYARKFPDNLNYSRNVEKVYQKTSIGQKEAQDLQLRKENAITLDSLAYRKPDDSKIYSESCKSSGIEPNILNDSSWSDFRSRPGMLAEDLVKFMRPELRDSRNKKTEESPKSVAPKKPARKKREESPVELFDNSRTDSTMYRSFMDFQKLDTPKVGKDGIYERTSTLKKRIKANGESKKSSAKELFEPEEDVGFEKLNHELDQLCDDMNQSDFVKEMNNAIMESPVQNNTSSKSVEDVRLSVSVDGKRKKRRSQNCSLNGSYRFTIGDFSLPKTPIARNNKLLRYAWLQDKNSPSPQKGQEKESPARANMSNPFTNTNESPISLNYANKNFDLQISGNFDKAERPLSDIQSNLDSSNSKSPKKLNVSVDELNHPKKHYNVNIKIHRDGSQIVQDPPLDESINIKLFSSPLSESQKPAIKINDSYIDLNSISRIGCESVEDMNKKYYPNMPEMFSEAIQKQREKSFLNSSQKNVNDERFEKSLWHKELSICELKEAEDETKRTSVKDAVKFIESTFGSPFTIKSKFYGESSKSCQKNLKFSEENLNICEENLNSHQNDPQESVFAPLAGNYRGHSSKNDSLDECMQIAHESINKLCNLFQNRLNGDEIAENFLRDPDRDDHEELAIIEEGDDSGFKLSEDISSSPETPEIFETSATIQLGVDGNLEPISEDSEANKNSEDDDASQKVSEEQKSPNKNFLEAALEIKEPVKPDSSSNFDSPKAKEFETIKENSYNSPFDTEFRRFTKNLESNENKLQKALILEPSSKIPEEVDRGADNFVEFSDENNEELNDESPKPVSSNSESDKKNLQEPSEIPPITKTEESSLESSKDAESSLSNKSEESPKETSYEAESSSSDKAEESPKNSSLNSVASAEKPESTKVSTEAVNQQQKFQVTLEDLSLPSTSQGTSQNSKLINQNEELLKLISKSLESLAIQQQNQQSSDSEMIPPLVVMQTLSDSQSTIGATPKKKITTKVTVNFKKISRRSSDVGADLQRMHQQFRIGDNARHSICSSSEVLQRLSTQLKRSSESDEGECSNSAVIPSDNKLEVPGCSANRAKYFCRNCGFTMLPERLNQLPASGRLSIASSLVDSMCTLYDGNGKQLAPVRHIETKSTEDLYIDDDFCQDFSLGANIELLPPPNNDFFGSIDFDFLSAEIFHTQEHEEIPSNDDTLSPNQVQNQIEFIKDNEDEEKQE